MHTTLSVTVQKQIAEAIEYTAVQRHGNCTADRVMREIIEPVFQPLAAKLRARRNRPVLLLPNARQRAYRPLAGPFSESEAWMVDNVVSDMERGEIDYCLVHEAKGLSVYRRGMIEVDAKEDK